MAYNAKTALCQGLGLNRRKTQLICTDKAQPVIRKGRMVQESFFELLFEGTDEEAGKLFFEVIGLMGKNLDKILDGGG